MKTEHGDLVIFTLLIGAAALLVIAMGHPTEALPLVSDMINVG